MDVILELEGRVRIERQHRTYVATWLRLNGPHYREACTAMLDDVKKRGGLECYVSDPSGARDIQNQEDIFFATAVVKELIDRGCRRFIVVSPRSAVTKLATNRMGRVVDDAGVERVMVETIDEALQLAGLSNASESSTMRPQ
ncbi:MAG: hypothetical protein DI536_01160 [Archangium gephyra]|uniref:STAS domain-containing protein n=1 Tax=Archangium gephyra TaxID=48 RepID=A0A2W5TWM1_9BACT|nr:MAG: hypothetical protein DI536_01160 [Archangium gephyra]